MAANYRKADRVKTPDGPRRLLPGQGVLPGIAAGEPVLIYDRPTTAIFAVGQPGEPPRYYVLATDQADAAEYICGIEFLDDGPPDEVRTHKGPVPPGS
jgi:hypothetical protein